MAGNKKPKKKYVPRYATKGFDAVAFVVSGLRAVKPAVVDKLRIQVHSAMHSLTHGAATKADWDDVSNALNLTKALCLMGHGDHYLAEVNDAMVAHSKCGERKILAGNFGYAASELALVNFAIELHEVHLSELPVVAIEAAVKDIEKELNTGKKNISVSRRALQQPGYL